MRKTLFITLAVFLALPSIAQLKLPRPSQKSSVMQTVGLTDITITYSRPGVKGRKIFGGLVPYGKVWRTGANETTQKVMLSATAAVAAAPADDWNTALRAATFAFDNNRPADAEKWLDQSLKIKETMSNVWLKARMQAAAGHKAEAVKTAEHALAIKTDKDSKELADEIAHQSEGWKK